MLLLLTLLPLLIEVRYSRSLDLAMKASFNSKERSVQDWKELFNRADSRFHVENIKLVPSSGLGTIHAVWHGD